MGTRILVVEDDPGIARLLNDNLTIDGFDVRLAPTGHDALRECQSFAPDLVLCFGAHTFFRDPALHAALAAVAPDAVLAGCSSAGEILESQVHDGTLAITALRFDGAQARGASTTRRSGTSCPPSRRSASRSGRSLVHVARSRAISRSTTAAPVEATPGKSLAASANA